MLENDMILILKFYRTKIPKLIELGHTTFLLKFVYTEITENSEIGIRLIEWSPMSMRHSGAVRTDPF